MESFDHYEDYIKFTEYMQSNMKVVSETNYKLIFYIGLISSVKMYAFHTEIMPAC